MHPHIALLVKAELEKLLGAKFIRAIDYAKWISNIVPISNMTKPFEFAKTLEMSIEHAQRMTFHFLIET